jgi:uncharacterized protein
VIARALVPRKSAAYIRQLCNHFAHRIPASHDEHTGRITFDAGTCELVAGADQLPLIIKAPTSMNPPDF